VDEIAHFPRMISGMPYKQISDVDARLASKNKVPVITTVAVSLFQGRTIKPEDFPSAKKYQAIDMKRLYQNGVQIAIGSDNPNDNSVKEIFYIKDLGVFDNLTLLKMWTETTPKVIFPDRKIGALKEGYEASFLALEGNPLDDFNNVKKIKIRFKQGIIIK
jgi:imidazolonepropionase-like amidohydrolase